MREIMNVRISTNALDNEKKLILTKRQQQMGRVRLRA